MIGILWFLTERLWSLYFDTSVKKNVFFVLQMQQNILSPTLCLHKKHLDKKRRRQVSDIFVALHIVLIVFGIEVNLTYILSFRDL